MATIDQPQPETPKKVRKPFYKRVWLWILFIAVVLAIIGGLSTGGKRQTDTKPTATGTDTSQATSVKPAEDTVELRATATGRGSADWGEVGSSHTETFTKTWSKTISGEEAKKGYVLTVTGDFTGNDNQEVSCTVLVNGVQKDHKTGSGAAGSALCDTSGLL
ncbi:MAG: hypothetical protein IJV49_03900 [Aeriscardovia sp.]|nr:hypothetical protein [Aeriscardovia sp.]